MSYFQVRVQCKKCSTEIDYYTGMVGIVFMGPNDKDLQCVNKECDGVGYNNFKLANTQPIVGRDNTFFRME